MEHNHCHCKHENLAYCSVCNVVYCKDCKSEWHQDSSITTWTYPNITYAGGLATYSCNNGCSHESEVK